MKRINVSIVLLFLFACAGSKPIITSQADADRGAQKYPGYTFEDLNKGKALFESNCGTCHGLKKPSSRNEVKWAKVLKEMVPKANKRAGKEVIGEVEKELMLKFLVTMGANKNKK